MKLLELNPSFIATPDRRGMGIIFDCPCCTGKTGRERMRICVAFKNPLDGGSPFDLQGKRNELNVAAGGELHRVEATNAHPAYSYSVQPADLVMPSVLWNVSGVTFEQLSITPSVNAAPAGHWHGYVTGGQCANS